ncbi:MAG: hypothetical protein IJ935_07450 [Afipia sp.]|nr:hypothetical protein [Afipia sp.]
MIYRGSLGEISNKADWVSRVYTLVNESDGSEIDLSNPALGVEIELVVRKSGCRNDLIKALLSDGDGKITLNGTGFQWQLAPADLSGLCAATYDVGVAVTISGVKHDVILADVAVLEGV